MHSEYATSRAPELRRLVQACLRKADREWARRIADYAARMKAAIETLAEGMEAVDQFEVEAEEISPAFAALNALLRLGVRFDPSFIARMKELRADAARLDLDSDDDCTDERCGDDGFGNHLEHESMSPADARFFIGELE